MQCINASMKLDTTSTHQESRMQFLCQQFSHQRQLIWCTSHYKCFSQITYLYSPKKAANTHWWQDTPLCYTDHAIDTSSCVSGNNLLPCWSGGQQEGEDQLSQEWHMTVFFKGVCEANHSTIPSTDDSSMDTILFYHHWTTRPPPSVFWNFSSTEIDWQWALQVELVPLGILATTDRVNATITVAMDTVLADSTDHDPSFGISDDLSFVGIQYTDQANYHNLSLCRHFEGDKDGILLKNVIDPNGPLVASRTFTSETKIQIRPTEWWGPCHTENDGGYTNIVNYQCQLDLSKGLVSGGVLRWSKWILSDQVYVNRRLHGLAYKHNIDDAVASCRIFYKCINSPNTNGK